MANEKHDVNAELVVALEEAIRLIRLWHGMGVRTAAEEKMWALYQASPEMKRLNAALAKARS